MCGKGTNKTTATAPPAYIANAQQGLLSQAQNVAAKPYTPYGGQLTAGFTPTQTNAAASLANLGPLSSSDINQYMSPYLNDVVNATQANINETNAEQQQQLQGNAISAGAWGGDRAGVAAAELARQQNLAGQQTIANLYNQGYGQALSTAQGQQQFGLQNAEAQFGIGTQEQQTNQAGLTANYQQWLNQQQYPFATTSYLANIINSSAPGAGSTTTEKTQGSLLGDLFGSAASILGLPSGNGSTVGGDAYSGLFGGSSDVSPVNVTPSVYGTYASGGGVGPSNVVSMGEALRRLPPQVLAQLHARMSGHPMMRQALATGGVPDDFAAPYLPMAQAFVQSKPLQPAQQAPQSSSGGGGGLGDILKIATMFAKNGGAIRGYADGGLPYDAASDPSVADLTGATVPSLASVITRQLAAPAPQSAAPAIPAPANSNPAPAASLASLNGTNGGSSWGDDAMRSPLLNFGLATLAGSNDPGASAIGRGGMAALQGVATQRKAELDAALQREQLRGLSTEDSLKDLQLKAYQQLGALDPMSAGPASTGAGPTDVTGHVNSLMNEADAGSALAAPTGTGTPPSTRKPQSTDGAAPVFNATSLMRQYNIASHTPGMEGIATHLLSVINQGVPEGYYLGQDGGVYPRPGYLQGVAQKAGLTAAATANATPHFTATHDAMGNPLAFDTRTGTGEQIAGAGGSGSGPLTLGDFAAKITAPESGGDPNAHNPRSTATGSAQFIDGTWLNLIKGARPDLAKGQSDANLLALRSNPALSAEMTQVYAQQNADVLGKSNVPVTSASLYLAHMLGPDGAIKVAGSPTSAPLTSILPANVIAANPGFRNMTAGDLTHAVAGKVGTDPVDVSGSGTAAGALSPHDNTPASVDTVAKQIAGYHIAPLTGFSMRSPWGQAVMAKVAELNPDYNAGQFASRNRAMGAFGSGPQGNAVRSFNVALSHLDTLGSMVGALQNGNVQLFNQLGNTVAQQFGAPAPTNFDAVKHIVGDEIVKAVVGSGGGVGDRDKASAAINSANSPQQLQGVIDSYKKLMAGQLHGLRQQYETSTGLHDFFDKLSPEAIQEIGMPVGTIYKGRTYLGGDMSKQASWKPVQQ